MYREYGPAPALRAHVDQFWTDLEDGRPAPRAAKRVLPDGCVDILIDPQGASVVGTMTRALVVPEGPRTRIVAVRFRPGAAFALLGVPAHELTDRRVALADLGPAARALGERLMRAADADRMRAVLEQEIGARIAGGAPLDPLVRAAIARIESALTPRAHCDDGPRTPRVAELARALGVTRQHLTRRFRHHVGIGPKELVQVLRMTLSCRALASPIANDGAHAGRARTARNTSRGAAGLAHALGYCDQSHMIHEFKALTGLTPGAYAGSISPRRAPAGEAPSGP